MASCHEMRTGEVYVCDTCGLEMQVMKECRDVGKPVSDCQCAPCTIVCCGEEMRAK